MTTEKSIDEMVDDAFRALEAKVQSIKIELGLIPDPALSKAAAKPETAVILEEQTATIAELREAVYVWEIAVSKKDQQIKSLEDEVVQLKRMLASG